MAGIPMTAEGRRRIEEELRRYEEVERPRNIRDIADARALGDLSENAEYHAAKERQGLIEGRIAGLREKLSLAVVVEPGKGDCSKVSFGATVKVLDGEMGRSAVFTIVGEGETDAGRGRISMGSPVGRALIGREVGESVTVVTPSREIEYEIVSIEFV